MRNCWFLVFLVVITGIIPASALPLLPSANFTVEPVQGSALEPVRFTDTSTGNPLSWYWDFGDGETSTLQNPDHTYSYLGVYTVSLKVSNSAGSNISAPREVFMADSGTLVPTTVALQQVTATDMTTPTASLPSGGAILAIMIGACGAYRRR
jgi:PKD repeat protein